MTTAVQVRDAMQFINDQDAATLERFIERLEYRGTDPTFTAYREAYLRRIELPPEGKLGVSVAGDTRAWPGEKAQAELPELSPFSADAPYLEIFNRGRSPLQFTVSPAEPWVHVSQKEGGVTTQTRVDVRVDWPHAPDGHTDVPIRITAGGDTVTVLAHVSNPPVERIPTNAHVEADGYVAVQARHFQHAVRIEAIDRGKISQLRDVAIRRNRDP